MLALAILLALARSPDAPAPPGPNPPPPLVAEVAMRDGTRLAADVYLPAAPGRHPVIIEATPYGRRSALSFATEREYWPAHGYAFVIIDVRGQHDSGGDFGFLRDGIGDGHDMVEWAAEQPWSNGRIGMRGSSYSGSLSWYAARTAPPHLRCINPNAAVADPFIGPPYLGGAIMADWALSWISGFAGRDTTPGQRIDFGPLTDHRPLLTADVAATGRVLPTYRQILAHPTADDFWRPVRFTTADYAGIAIPTLAFSGWFDGTLPGTVRNFQAMRAASPARADQFLVIGPWDHATAADGGWDYASGDRASRIGRLTLPDNAFLPAQRMTLAFFDWCLKGAARPQMPAVQAYVPGADRWLTGDDFPIAGTLETSFYLSSAGHANGRGGDGRLVATAADGAADTFPADPRHPIGSHIDGRLASGPVDVATLLDRPDTLSYVTPPLARPLAILGRVRLELHAAVDARDADFVAVIEDVHPDGSAVKLGSGFGGVLRARYRQGFDRQVPLVPRRVERLTVDLMEVGTQIASGHRLRLTIMGSAWPLISVNPHTGNPIATDTAPPRMAATTIFHDAARPSRLVVPVIALPPPSVLPASRRPAP